MSESVFVGSAAVDAAYEAHKTVWGVGRHHYPRVVDQSIEEMAELTKALLKERRYPDRYHRAQVLEEMADVIFCLEFVARQHSIGPYEITESVDAKAMDLVQKLTFMLNNKKTKEPDP